MFIPNIPGINHDTIHAKPKTPGDSSSWKFSRRSHEISNCQVKRCTTHPHHHHHHTEGTRDNASLTKRRHTLHVDDATRRETLLPSVVEPGPIIDPAVLCRRRTAGGDAAAEGAAAAGGGEPGEGCEVDGV